MAKQSSGSVSCILWPKKSSSCDERKRLSARQPRGILCNSCPATFKRPKYLKRHLLICPGLRRREANTCDDVNVCHICNAAFKRKKYLKRHLKRCELKRSARADDSVGFVAANTDSKENGGKLKETQNSVSQAQFARNSFMSCEKKHKCSICGEKYFQLKHLQRHMSLFHEGGHVCPNCSQWFRLRMNLNKHLHTCTLSLENHDPEALDED